MSSKIALASDTKSSGLGPSILRDFRCRRSSVAMDLSDMSVFARSRAIPLARAALKWSQKTGQSAKVYPKPLKGYENGEAPEFYRSV